MRVYKRSSKPLSSLTSHKTSASNPTLPARKPRCREFKLNDGAETKAEYSDGGSCFRQ